MYNTQSIIVSILECNRVKEVSMIVTLLHKSTLQRYYSEAVFSSRSSISASTDAMVRVVLVESYFELILYCDVSRICFEHMAQTPFLYAQAA